MKKRFRNKTFVVSLALAVVTFINQMIRLFGYEPLISEDLAGNLINVVATVLMMLGIIIDPTTSGITDGENEEEEF